MNVGKFLVELGYTPPPERLGFPRPTVIHGRKLFITPVGYGAETLEEVEADIDHRKTVGERATTNRSPGNWF